MRTGRMEVLYPSCEGCESTANVVDVEGEDNKSEGIRSLGECVGGGERVPQGGPESNGC